MLYYRFKHPFNDKTNEIKVTSRSYFVRWKNCKSENDHLHCVFVLCKQTSRTISKKKTDAVKTGAYISLVNALHCNGILRIFPRVAISKKFEQPLLISA